MTIEPDDYPARLGTGAHLILSTAIDDPKGEPLHVANLAYCLKVDQEELATIGAMTVSAWRRFQEATGLFPEPLTDWKFKTLATGNVTLDGSSDVINTSSGVLRVLDLKSGWKESDCEAQLRGYGLLGMEEFGLGAAEGYVLRPRLGTIEKVGEWSREQLTSWWQGIAGKVAGGERRYHPAPENCGLCSRRYECPGKAKLVVDAVCTLPARNDDGSPGWYAGGLTPRSAYEAVRMARYLKAECERVLKVIGNEVTLDGGELVDADGYGLRYKESAVDVILPRPGWEILSEIGEALDECLRVTNGDLETAVKAALPRGQKGKGWMAYLERLREAGAVENRASKALTLVAPQITEQTNEPQLTHGE